MGYQSQSVRTALSCHVKWIKEQKLGGAPDLEKRLYPPIALLEQYPHNLEPAVSASNEQCTLHTIYIYIVHGIYGLSIGYLMLASEFRTESLRGCPGIHTASAHVSLGYACPPARM